MLVGRIAYALVVVVAYVFLVMILLSCATRPPPLFPKEQLPLIRGVIEGDHRDR